MKGARYKPVGWKGESHRHYLAAKGIKTAPKRYYYTPTFVAGDMSLIAADGVGTAGAAAVSLIPLAVVAGGLYFGARGVKRKTEGKSFFNKKSKETESLPTLPDFGEVMAVDPKQAPQFAVPDCPKSEAAIRKSQETGVPLYGTRIARDDWAFRNDKAELERVSNRVNREE